jgi:hypothetical protein
VQAQGRSFIVDDADDGTAFTLEEVRRMAKAVHPKLPA